jgi:hypothetical protein
MNVELPHDWSPRAYQDPTWNFFFPNAKDKRAVVIAHRRWGKDLLGVNLCGCKAHERVGTYWHVLPTYRQGRNIVWNGVDYDGRAFLDYLHPALVRYKHTNDMRVHFKNGSIYQVVGSDEIDRLVGTNPVGVILSEYALQDPRAWDYIAPILRENHGWALFITTLRGKNHAYRLARISERLQREGDPNWFYINQTVDDTVRDDGTPVVSREDIEKERKAGRPEAIIQQEFYNNAEAPLAGAYYSHEMNKLTMDGRIKNVPHDPKLFTDTSWDLGYNDTTTIIFTQTHGREIRVIDYYENSGEALRHYVRVLREKDYMYGKHYMPHDVTVHSINDGKTRLETLRTLGLKCHVTFKHSVEDGIEQVRNTLPQCWFDERKCERLIEALRSYRKEEAPARLGYTGGEEDLKPMFKDNPLHDWSSNCADAFRIFAWNVKRRDEQDEDQKKLPDRMVDSDYQWV